MPGINPRSQKRQFQGHLILCPALKGWFQGSILVAPKSVGGWDGARNGFQEGKEDEVTCLGDREMMAPHHVVKAHQEPQIGPQHFEFLRHPPPIIWIVGSLSQLVYCLDSYWECFLRTAGAAGYLWG